MATANVAADAAEGLVERQLLEAAANGDVPALEKLIEEGADLAYQDEEGMSALMKAADGGYEEAVVLLLQAGCPWNLQDKEGYCAGQYAAGNPHIIEMLMNWGVQAELLLGATERASSHAEASTSGTPVNQAYLEQRLRYSEDGTKLLDADGEAVMMGWEAPLMLRHAAVIAAKGGHVLNVGFGLGLVDDALQALEPSAHTIIEAHPDVFAHAEKLGWSTRPGVSLLRGRWQDVLPGLIAQGVRFDGIFFDTYGEYWADMHDFHQLLPKLLVPGGIYSFFNGLAPDNVFFHSVYGRLAQLELGALGLAVTYEKVVIREVMDPKVWEGVANKYWHLPYYWLPTCVYTPPADHETVPDS